MASEGDGGSSKLMGHLFFALRVLPALTPMIIWAVSVEVRMPREVPPDWFREEVKSISEKLDRLEGKVSALDVKVTTADETAKANQRLISIILKMQEK